MGWREELPGRAASQRSGVGRRGHPTATAVQVARHTLTWAPASITRFFLSRAWHFSALSGPQPALPLLTYPPPPPTPLQNFDEVLVPADHVSRSPNDTYYVDSATVLRCHTSAHQAEVLRSGQGAFLVTGDVYRCARGWLGRLGWVGDWWAGLPGYWRLSPPAPAPAPAAIPWFSPSSPTSHFFAAPAGATRSTQPTTPCSTRWRACACLRPPTGRRPASTARPLPSASSRRLWRGWRSTCLVRGGAGRGAAPVQPGQSGLAWSTGRPAGSRAAAEQLVLVSRCALCADPQAP